MAGTMESSTSPVIGNAPSPTLILERKGKGEESTYEGLSQPQVLGISIPSGNSSITLISKDLECPESGVSTPRRLGSFAFPRVSSSTSIKGGFISSPPSPRACPSTPIHDESMDLVKVRVGIEKQMKQIEHLSKIVANVNIFWREESHWSCLPLMIDALLDTEAPIPTRDQAIRTYPICRINLGRTEGEMDSFKRAFALAKEMSVTNRGFTTLPFIVKDNTDQPKADDRILFDKLLARDDAISKMITSELARLVAPYALVTRCPDQRDEILAGTPTIPLDDARRNLCFLWPTFRVVRLSVLQTALAVLDTKGAVNLPTPVSPEEDEGLFMKGRRHSRQLSITSIFSRKSSVLSLASTTSTQTTASPGSTPATSVTNSPALTPMPSPEMKRRFAIPRLSTPSSESTVRMTTPKASPRMLARDSSSTSLSSMASMTVPMAPPKQVAKARTSVFTGPPRLIPLQESIILGGDEKTSKEEKPVNPPPEAKRTCSCAHHHEVPWVKQRQL